jgi:hypothetical protein
MLWGEYPMATARHFSIAFALRINNAGHKNDLKHHLDTTHISAWHAMP